MPLPDSSPHRDRSSGVPLTAAGTPDQRYKAAGRRSKCKLCVHLIDEGICTVTGRIADGNGSRGWCEDFVKISVHDRGGWQEPVRKKKKR